MFGWVVGFVFGTFVLIPSIEAKYRKEIIHYPQDTQFYATDFFVQGCKNFLDRCPKAYKVQLICARSYAGDFKNFGNYCEMQYENCNTWKSKFNYQYFLCSPLLQSSICKDKQQQNWPRSVYRWVVVETTP